MTVINPEQTLANQLIALKSQYEQALTEADAKATHFREQLSHVNALLLNQLVPSVAIPSQQAHLESSVTALALPPQLDDASVGIPLNLTFNEDLPQQTPTPPAKPRKGKTTQAALEPSQSSRKGSSQTLLPAYQGMKRLEAIAQVLGATPGKEVSIDSLTQSLFGDLSTAEHKKERLRLKTLLYQGVKLGLWQKAATPSSYLTAASIGKSKGRSKKNSQPPQNIPTESVAVKLKPSNSRKTPGTAAKPRTQKKASAQTAQAKAGVTPTTKKRNSLPLLPVYQGVTKLEAIRSVLKTYAGEDLHHDTIIQSLYGDLSPADLKAERIRIKTALLTGVKNKLWGKSPKPSTYRLDALNPPSESNGKGAVAPSTAQSATKAPAAKGRKKPVAAKTSTRSTTAKPSRRKSK
jgi:hypothetical protein